MLRFFSVLLLCVGVSACTGNQTTDFNDNLGGSALEIFSDAEEAASRKRYQEAIDLYGEVERQYPLDPLAIRAQLAKAETLLKYQKYEEAVSAFDRFLQFNPSHPETARAIYLRALAFYEQIPDVHRDQGVTLKTQTAFNQLITAYPETPEAIDAQAKLAFVKDQLAGHNLIVGITYQQQNRYLAAQNRFKTVIEDYPTSGQIPEAFYRLVETSLALGLAGEAQAYAATLGYNFPDSTWYKRAYNLLTN